MRTKLNITEGIFPMPVPVSYTHLRPLWCVALPTEPYQHDKGKNLVFENKHQINTKQTKTRRAASKKTPYLCGFAGFWPRFYLLITNQLHYRLCYTSIKLPSNYSISQV